MTNITNSATRAPIIIKIFGKSASVNPVDPIVRTYTPHCHKNNLQHIKILETMGVRISSLCNPILFILNSHDLAIKFNLQTHEVRYCFTYFITCAKLIPGVLHNEFFRENVKISTVRADATTVVLSLRYTVHKQKQ